MTPERHPKPGKILVKHPHAANSGSSRGVVPAVQKRTGPSARQRGKSAPRSQPVRVSSARDDARPARLPRKKSILSLENARKTKSPKDSATAKVQTIPATPQQLLLEAPTSVSLEEARNMVADNRELLLEAPTSVSLEEVHQRDSQPAIPSPTVVPGSPVRPLMQTSAPRADGVLGADSPHSLPGAVPIQPARARSASHVVSHARRNTQVVRPETGLLPNAQTESPRNAFLIREYRWWRSASEFEPMPLSDDKLPFDKDGVKKIYLTKHPKGGIHLVLKKTIRNDKKEKVQGYYLRPFRKGEPEDTTKFENRIVAFLKDKPELLKQFRDAIAAFKREECSTLAA